MRYSEILGGSVTTLAVFIVTKSTFWWQGTSLSESKYLPEITLATLLLVSAGAVLARVTVRQAGKAIKNSYNRQALEDTASSVITSAATHVGDAIETAIDRIDRGDTQSRGVVQSFAGWIASVKYRNVRQEVKVSVDATLQAGCHLPAFISHRVAERVASFVSDEVIPTLGQEMLVPRFLK